MRIPTTGTDRETVIQRLRDRKHADAAWEAGRSMTNMYFAEGEGRKVAEEAYTLYLWENALDPTAYQSIPGLERDVMAMAADHLGGDDQVVGSFTSGGTESVLMAVKAARDRSRTRQPDLDRREIVIASSGHACFHKAAQYLDLDVTVVPVDPKTYRADVAAMAEAVTDRTIMVVGSAPGYPHGVIDPITELGALALERDLWLHVDGCIGGFVLPFFAELGADIEPFDFSVPGVTSMSMDFHKYALCAKGASCVLYRTPEHRRPQFFAYSGWPGYVVVNATAQSSKSGGPIAATWATLTHYGRDGYLEIFGQVRAATATAIAAVDANPDLHLMGEPAMCIFSISSDVVDVFELADAMKVHGWDMYPQLGHGGLPPTLHVSVMPRNVPQIDEWAADLDRCVAGLKAARPTDGLAEVRAMLDELDLSSLSTDEIEGLMAMAGIGADSIGGDMADVNRLLDDLPTDVCDRVLTVFLDQLTRQASA